MDISSPIHWWPKSVKTSPLKPEPHLKRRFKHYVEQRIFSYPISRTKHDSSSGRFSNSIARSDSFVCTSIICVLEDEVQLARETLMRSRFTCVSIYELHPHCNTKETQRQSSMPTSTVNINVQYRVGLDVRAVSKPWLSFSASWRKFECTVRIFSLAIFRILLLERANELMRRLLSIDATGWPGRQWRTKTFGLFKNWEISVMIIFSRP